MSRDCFSKAVQAIMPALRGFTRRLSHDASDDIVQETLLRAWGARSRFEPGTNFKAWLFRIARNCFLTEVTRPHHNKSVPWSPELHDRLMMDVPMQEEGLFAKELDQAIASLPPSQAAALILITRDGLSYEEAAQRSGKPLNTIKSDVARARQRVVAFLTHGAAYQPTTHSSLKGSQRTSTITYQRWKDSGFTMIG